MLADCVRAHVHARVCVCRYGDVSAAVADGKDDGILVVAIMFNVVVSTVTAQHSNSPVLVVMCLRARACVCACVCMCVCVCVCVRAPA